MEGMDGFEVAVRLNSDPRTARIPIVILTARDLTMDDRERLRGKIALILQKSEASADRLVSVIDDLLARHARERAPRPASGA
jgi:CheY-like chemotaxis protein